MHPQRWVLITALVLATGYVWLSGGFVGITGGMHAQQGGTAVQPPQKPGLAVATFAAGCFWCTEADFDKVRGVVSTTSGYTGGKVANPTYRQVITSETGHAEAVQVVFDPAVVSYEALLDHFWRNVDPFVAHRQFCDVGNQYRPEIFFHDAVQRAAAEASKGANAGEVSPPADRRRDHAGRAVLSRGGLSPGLLQEELRAVPVLSIRMRP